MTTEHSGLEGEQLDRYDEDYNKYPCEINPNNYTCPDDCEGPEKGDCG